GKNQSAPRLLGKGQPATPAIEPVRGERVREPGLPRQTKKASGVAKPRPTPRVRRTHGLVLLFGPEVLVLVERLDADGLRRVAFLGGDAHLLVLLQVSQLRCLAVD